MPAFKQWAFNHRGLREHTLFLRNKVRTAAFYRIADSSGNVNFNNRCVNYSSQNENCQCIFVNFENFVKYKQKMGYCFVYNRKNKLFTCQAR